MSNATTALPRGAAHDLSSLRRLLPQLLTAITAIAGAGLVAYGVSQPWLSTFAGLLTKSGWGTRNGDILLGLASAAAAVAVAQVFAAPPTLRWVLGALGFVTTAFAGYLLVQLYVVTRQLDGMVLGQKEPGLYITTAGAALIFATLFLPMPAADSVSGRTAALVASDRTHLWVPRRSWLRFPVAGLALVAGLAHVPVTPEHLQEAPYIGYLFMSLTVTCALVAAALLIADNAALYAAAATACLLAVCAYVFSRTIGLPQMGDDVGNWFEPLGVLSILCESAVVLLSVSALRLRPSPPRG